MKAFLKKQIALPQDHGSWVFILSPLLIGIFAGRAFTFASFSLCLAAMAAFLIRQPVTVAIKAYSGRRPRTDLPAARFWIALYSIILVLALAYLVWRGFNDLLYLAIPGIPVFLWHLHLVSRRAERRQAGVEILATGVLSLIAPATYWVGIRHYDPTGWWLWLLTWLQSAASIVYAYVRLEQRDLAQSPGRAALWRMGQRAFLYTSFNVVLTFLASLFGWLPRWLFLPYLLQWGETWWGIFHPAIRWKPIKIGIRQLIISTAWTILFIVFWLAG
ncbi:MAG: YwiC-like family protein [Anaerolineae bacterium]